MLEIETREIGGTSEVRALRRTGKIPGVLYGNGREAFSFAVESRHLRETLAAAGGRHAILEVKVPGSSTPITPPPSVMTAYRGAGVPWSCSSRRSPARSASSTAPVARASATAAARTSGRRCAGTWPAATSSTTAMKESTEAHQF